MRPADLPPLQVLAERNPHGTRVKYMGGCRCPDCRAAAVRCAHETNVRRRQGLDNGLTSAEPARQHLLSLSRQGVGKRAVADVSGVAKSVIDGIKNGRKRQIRKDTARKILAVTVEAAFDGGLVDAGRTRELIEQLLEEGFSRAELARRLGDAVPALQFCYVKSGKITARTARRVELFYRRVMT